MTRAARPPRRRGLGSARRGRPRGPFPGRAAVAAALGAATFGASPGAAQDGAAARPDSLLVELRGAVDAAPVGAAVVWLEPARGGAAEGPDPTAGPRGDSARAPRRIVAAAAADRARYRLAAPAGRYVLHVRAGGYRPASRPVELPRPGRLVLRLEPAPLPVRELFARVEREADGAARTVHRLSADDRPLGGLAGWLAALPGVEVRARGPGGRGTVGVRGSRPEAVRVTLDGVPLDDPLTGAADLSLVPAGSLDGAVVTLGASPGTGGGATAGRVDLRSRAPGEGVAGAVGVGSFGRVFAELSAGARGRTGAVGVSALLERARNDFPYENRVRAGRPEERRRNADREGVHATLSGRLADLPVAGLLRVDAVERGTPGRMGSRLFDEARWEERVALAAVRLGEEETRRVAARYARRIQRYTDPRVELRETLHAEHAGASGAWSPSADPAWRLEGHLTREVVWGAPLDGRRSRWRAGAALSRALGDGPLVVTPGLGFDAAPGVTALSPSLGTVLRPGAALRLWARAGRAIRVPTFADLYLAPEQRIRPDPDLRPERVRLDAELGASWSPGPAPLALRATAWYRRTDDPIVWLPSPTAVWSPRNAGHLEALGVEVEADWAVTPAWRLGFGGTLARSRVRFAAADDRLPYEAPWTARLAVERIRGERRAGLGVRAVGPRPTDPAGTHRLDPFARVDLRVREPLRVAGLELEVEAAVLNLFDARYERVELFPEPGRQLELRLGVRTDGARLQASGSRRSLSSVVEPAPHAAAGEPARPAPADARAGLSPRRGGR